MCLCVLQIIVNTKRVSIWKNMVEDSMQKVDMVIQNVIPIMRKSDVLRELTKKAFLNSLVVKDSV